MELKTTEFFVNISKEQARNYASNGIRAIVNRIKEEKYLVARETQVKNMSEEE